jgi:hypothetical protein
MSRFVIVYNDNSDPPAQDERRIVASLTTAKVIDQMPGTLLVDGPEAEVATAVSRLDKWSFSPERPMAANPPRAIKYTV